MSTTVAVPELSVREQRKKQLKNVANKSVANEKTNTNIIYNMILGEYAHETRIKLKTEKKILEDMESKPIRNIFKMSRVLVPIGQNKKSSKGQGKQDDQLTKINDADGDGQPQGDEFELNYSVSSESEDEEDHSNI
tara:strand:+ start:91 stop:498 length:408 start_codon:yes stop_codon:yes gene_type:complete